MKEKINIIFEYKLEYEDKKYRKEAIEQMCKKGIFGILSTNFNIERTNKKGKIAST